MATCPFSVLSCRLPEWQTDPCYVLSLLAYIQSPIPGAGFGSGVSCLVIHVVIGTVAPFSGVRISDV
jgi:hypothetical protein